MHDGTMDTDALRRDLERRREELTTMRQDLEASRQRLDRPEIEAEEQAQKQAMLRGLEQIDLRSRDEMEAVDMALQRLDTGAYGRCLRCGKDIDPERLRAVPWTSLCLECAATRQQPEPSPHVDIQSGEPSLTAPWQGLADEELRTAIRERLDADPRIDPGELTVTCAGRQVYVAGALPGAAQLEALREIVQDTLGVSDLETDIRLDPQAWQRRDRAPGRREPGRSDEETLLEGEPAEDGRPGTESDKDLRDGLPVDPPGHMVPSRES